MTEDDEDPMEFRLDPAEIKSIVTADLLAAKNENDKAVEETKAYVLGVITRTGITDCCNIEKEDVDGYEDALEDIKHVIHIVNPPDNEECHNPQTGMEAIVRKSLAALSEKAKIDTQVVQLMDKDLARETRRDMKQFYGQTKKFARGMSKDFQKKHKETNEEVEASKKIIRDKIFNFTQNLPMSSTSDDANTLASLFQNLAERTITDFGKSNRDSQEMTETAKNNLAAYVKTVFPPNQKTDEDLQSEDFIRDNLLVLKDKIISDMKDEKTATEQSIKDAKERVAKYPKEMLQGVKNISHLSMKKIRGKTIGFKDTVQEEEFEEEKYDLLPELSDPVEFKETEKENNTISEKLPSNNKEEAETSDKSKRDGSETVE